MNGKTTMLLGAGLLAASLTAMPVTARADSGDEALAFVVGAAVGHVIGGHDHRIVHVHSNHYRHAPRIKHFRWHARDQMRHHRWKHAHRWHKHEHKRDHRRHDRWDDKRDRWDGKRDRDHHRYRDHRRGRS